MIDIIIIVSLCFLILMALNFFEESARPQLFYIKNSYNETILSQCPLLLKPYKPTFLWGKSGHIQTILYGKIGRFNPPKLKGKRHYHVMKDGATITFDVFNSLNPENDKNCVLLICPGIANSAESSYIRTYIDFAQKNGYNVAVLNHLGAIRSIPLTSPRIYTYGDTEEFSLMVVKVEEQFPSHKLIVVGFSLGANIIIKYLGEKPDRQKKFIAAISCCQGYDIVKVSKLLLTWYKLRYIYVYSMTRHQLCILRHFKDTLFNYIESLNLNYNRQSGDSNLINSSQSDSKVIEATSSNAEMNQNLEETFANQSNGDIKSILSKTCLDNDSKLSKEQIELDEKKHCNNSNISINNDKTEQSKINLNSIDKESNDQILNKTIQLNMYLNNNDCPVKIFCNNKDNVDKRLSKSEISFGNIRNPHSQKQDSLKFKICDFEKLLKAKTLLQIDEIYSHVRAGFNSVQEYYQWASSSQFIDKVNIPLLIMNSEDDPIVPSEVHNIPKNHAVEHSSTIFMLTKHGGHLAFFEGGKLIPSTITWLDRVIIQYCDAVLNLNSIK